MCAATVVAFARGTLMIAVLSGFNAMSAVQRELYATYSGLVPLYGI